MGASFRRCASAPKTKAKPMPRTSVAMSGDASIRQWLQHGAGLPTRAEALSTLTGDQPDGRNDRRPPAWVVVFDDRGRHDRAAGKLARFVGDQGHLQRDSIAT